MSNEANKDQTTRFEVGQVIFRLQWSRLVRVKVLKITPKKVVIQDQCASYQQCQPDAPYNGSTWHVTGYDLNSLFPSELAAKRDELERLDATIENMLNDMAKLRNRQADLSKEVALLECKQDLGGFAPNG